MAWRRSETGVIEVTNEIANDLDITGSLQDMSPSTLLLININASIPDCLGRRRQLEKDARWFTQYAVKWDNRQLKNATCVIPLYVPRSKSWLNDRFNPNLADGWGIAPSESVFFGSCDDLGGKVELLGSELSFSRQSIIEMCARVNPSVRVLCAMQITLDEALRLERLTNIGFEWQLSSDNYRLGSDIIEGMPQELTGTVGQNWRRDSRLIERAGVSWRRASWSSIAVWASTLISDHNCRKGMRDHSQLVKMRHDLWQKCDDVELMAFTATAGDVTGVATALRGPSGEIQGLEMGISPGSLRLEIYVALQYRALISFARSAKCESVSLGTGSGEFKTRRGAVAQTMLNGIARIQLTR
jgi:hypothetical protein